MNEYLELRVPEEREFFDTFGLEPVADEGSTSRTLDFELDGGEQLVLSYDVVGRSVRCRWTHDGRQVLDLFREGVTTLTIESPSALTIVTDVGVLRGQLRIGLRPAVTVEEQLLLS